jgi:hypothetical protein
MVGLLALGAMTLPALAGKPEPPAKTEKHALENWINADAQADTLRQLEKVKWELLRVDREKRTLHISDTPAARSWGRDAAERMFTSAGAELALVGVPVSPDAKIVLDGKEIPLKELLDGVNLTVKFETDKAVIVSIEATTPPRAGYVVKSVDADKHILTVTRDKTDKPLVLPVAKGVPLRDMLKDLKPGTHVQLHLEVEDGHLVVHGLRER